MSDAERALQSVLDAAAAATDAAGRSLAFGPVPLTLHSDDPAMADDVLAHAVDGPPDPDWRPLRLILASGHAVPEHDLPAPLRVRGRPEGTTIVRAGALTAIVTSGMLWIVDDESGTALRWTPDADAVPIWERIRPLRVALRWWSVRHDAALMHAAAVGREGRAVLLVGDSGAGKSTTSVSCLGRGLDVLGDDYCIVVPGQAGAGVRVHATYRLANLTEQTLDLLPHLRLRIRGLGPLGKSFIGLDSLAPEAGVADVVGVAAVEQAPGETTRLDPATAMSVLRRLGPNTVAQIPGWTRETLAVCTTVVTRRPTFDLRVGSLDDACPVLIAYLRGAA